MPENQEGSGPSRCTPLGTSVLDTGLPFSESTLRLDDLRSRVNFNLCQSVSQTLV